MSPELVQGPFFTKQEAAKYLGYKPSYFVKLLKEYNIPRYGPAKTRFAKSVLDMFMIYPEKFRKQKTKAYGRQPQLLTID